MATATGKTVVGMMVWDRYRKFMELQHPARPAGKMLFIVNRNLLLAEAEQKLKLMYPNKYSIGRIYDGECTTDADVVFATRSSLMEAGRLQLLIKSGPIDLIVYDETHHLPAAEI